MGRGDGREGWTYGHEGIRVERVKRDGRGCVEGETSYSGGRTEANNTLMGFS